ncbi:MAG: hypothetical protein AAGI66_02930 [Cyanobacteria bacterium P01_H01_bin.74]
MAKTIHWPLQFKYDVLAEGTENFYVAFRIGRLYYDNRYWAPDEIVDIRVNHNIIRKGRVVGDLKLCTIAEINAEDFARLKPSLQNESDLIAFLSETYQQPVTQETLVTMVTYQNLALTAENVDVNDDPHL